LGSLFFLAHGCPDVRVDDVGTDHGRARIVKDLDATTRRGRRGARPLEDRGVPAEAGRARKPNVHAERRTEQREGVPDVVAVTDEDELDALEAAEVLEHGQG